MRTLKNIIQGSSEKFPKTNLSLSESNNLKKPVILLLESCACYETPIILILNYEEGKALLLGIRDCLISDAPEWLHDIWTAVGQFFGWDCLNDSSIIILSWIPVRISVFKSVNLKLRLT
jgi:hypothetical protein